MAHGGSPEWNQAVSAAVAPLRERIPTAIALGMADPVTLQEALDSLSERGAQRIAVVRLFLSGASFLHQTEFLFGLRPDPPPDPMMSHGDGDMGHGAAELRPLRHSADILLGMDGLGESDIAARVLQDRVRTALGAAPGPARILLLAHGMATESENDKVVRDMSVVAAALRADGLSDVEVATLREDWPEERAPAEARIRAWVAGSDGTHTTLVVPFRLFGFGPYAEVLEGLTYRTTEGLLPHALITEWIEGQARTLLCGRGGPSLLGSCATARVLP
jgi:hypothetical protein